MAGVGSKAKAQAPADKPSRGFFTRIVADNIKRLREEAGLTQRQMARAMRMHQPFISDIENGQVSLTVDKVAEFAMFFRVEPGYLLFPHHPAAEKVKKNGQVSE